MAVDKEKVLEAAQKYADREQYDKAVKEIQKVSDDYKDDCRVQLKLATYLEKGNRTSEAVAALTHVAGIYRNQGAAQKALAVIRQAQKLEKTNCELALMSAELCGTLGLSHEALTQLNSSLEFIDPVLNKETYGQILQMMVRVDSENTQTRSKYAKFLFDSNDVEGASRQYSLALALLLSKDRLVDYVQLAREYLKIVPDDAEVIRNLAEIYMKMSRYNDAVVIMTDLHEDKRTREIHDLLVRCYTQLRRPRDAVRELKVLARKLEDAGEREDVIEDVWMRAKVLDPNDADVIAALSGEELPMLSNSSLGIVSVNDMVPLMDDVGATPQRPVQAVQSQTGQLNGEFSMALEAYHTGDVSRASAICRRIIEIDEQHLPALRLIIEISEKTDDLAGQAYFERKFAKAVYQRDLNEAIRHIQIAERCTPHAWENYNMMLLFGVDPQQYGMTAPTAMGTSSASNHRVTQNVNTMGLGAARVNSGMFRAPNQVARTNSGMFRAPQEPRPASGVFRAPQEPVPGSGLRQPPGIPPVPSTNAGQLKPISSTSNARISAPPPIPRPSSLSSSVGAVPSNGGIPRPGGMKSGGSVIPPVPTASSMLNPAVPPVHIPPKRRMTTEIPAPMQNISNDVISDLRKLEHHRDVGAFQPGGAPVPAYPEPAQSGASVFGEGADNLDGELDDVFAGLVSDEPLKPAKSFVAPIAVPEEACLPTTARSSSPMSFSKPRATAPQAPSQAPLEEPTPASPQQSLPSAAMPQPSQASSRPVVGNRAVAAMRGGLSNRVTGGRAMPYGRGGAGTSGIRGSVPRATPVQASRPVMPAAPLSVSQPTAASIPEDAIQRVMETLQEVDFYVSLNLRGDAGKLLETLIAEFGDIGIIHDKKVELGF